MCMKGYLKYVLIRGGVLLVKLDGLRVIIKLLVDSWDLILSVSEPRIMRMHIDQEFSPIAIYFIWQVRASQPSRVNGPIILIIYMYVCDDRSTYCNVICVSNFVLANNV